MPTNRGYHTKNHTITNKAELNGWIAGKSKIMEGFLHKVRTVINWMAGH